MELFQLTVEKPNARLSLWQVRAKINVIISRWKLEEKKKKLSREKTRAIKSRFVFALLMIDLEVGVRYLI